MSEVIVYTKTYCPYCDRAKDLLKRKNAPYKEVLLQSQQEFNELKQKTGMMTVPQIFINGDLVGGYSELSDLDQKGELDSLLKGS